MVFSIGALFSVAGNLGGELWSILDPTMRSIAVFKSRNFSVFVISGFFFMAISTRYNLRLFSSLAWLGVFLAIIFCLDGARTKSRSNCASCSIFSFNWIIILAWIFSPIAICVQQPKTKTLHETAHRFGVLLYFMLPLLIFSGLLFIYLLMDDLSLLLSTTYGNVFLIKNGSLLLLWFGAINKFQLVPSIKNEPSVGRQAVKKVDPV